MWYFAYGSNLNARAVADWCRQGNHRLIPMRNGRPAVLDNFRLCFPIFSEYWQGGTADIAYDPGKSVAGAIFELSEADMKLIDAKIDRRLDSAGKEIGIYRRVDHHFMVGNTRAYEVLYWYLPFFADDITGRQLAADARRWHPRSIVSGRSPQ